MIIIINKIICNSKLCYVQLIQSPALGINNSDFHCIVTKINDNKETPTTGHQAPCQLCDTLITSKPPYHQ